MPRLGVDGGSWPQRVVALSALATCTCAVTLVSVGAVRHGSPPAGAVERQGAAAYSGPASNRPSGAARITVAWAGDTTLGSDYGVPPAQGRLLLGSVAAALHHANLTAVNYEGTLASSGRSKCASLAPDEDAPTAPPRCFAFRAPPENARTLRHVGVDLVNLANNHAFDYGPVAMGQTVDALRTAGLQVTGRPGEVSVRDVNGIRVAALGFAAYPWANDIRDLQDATATIRLAAARADVVIVFMHAGAEGQGHEHTPRGPENYLGESRGDVRAFAHLAVDAGADLVLGSGPHVLRGIELYRGRALAYSLGNLAGYRTFSVRGSMSLSGVLRVTVRSNGRYAGGQFTSLKLDSDGTPSRDPTQAAGRLVSRLSHQDFARAAVLVGSQGRLRLATDDRRAGGTADRRSRSADTADRRFSSAIGICAGASHAIRGPRSRTRRPARTCTALDTG